MGHFQAVKNENAVGDAGRVYQAVRRYTETLLWNDSRNADTFAWLVTGAPSVAELHVAGMDQPSAIEGSVRSEP